MYRHFWQEIIGISNINNLMYNTQKVPPNNLTPVLFYILVGTLGVKKKTYNFTNSVFQYL